MGCPQAITGHLAGLQGVKSITFDIESRTFIIIADMFSKDALVNALEEISAAESRNFILGSYTEV